MGTSPRRSALLAAINLNPAIDRTLVVERLRHEDRNPVLEWWEEAGGKAANVARAARLEGIGVRVLTPLGGDAGRRYRAMMREEGLPLEPVAIRDAIRVNETILQRTSSRQTRLNFPGPRLSRSEWADARARIDALLDRAEAAVFCGSLPRGVPAGAYGTMIRRARKAGCLTLLDADGEVFRKGLAAGPDWVKPNGYELIRALAALDGSTREGAARSIPAVVKAARRLRDFGAVGVLVSLGARGAVLLAPAGEALHAKGPRVRPVNTVGAGDVLAGMFLAALLRKVPLEEALRRAVAAGTASVLLPRTARFRREDYERLRRKTEVRRIRD